MSAASIPVAPVGTTITIPLRIRLFVDFWNLQSLLNGREGEAKKTDNARFQIDWQKLPAILIARAAAVIGASAYSYDGTIVFTSFDANTDAGRKHHKWATTWLDRQAGIQVHCYERRPRHKPRCQACHNEIAECPHCKTMLAGTVEKGVDTAIATDMIRLAWEKAYDVAVLASSDGDLVPAVEFLDVKGVRVIQAGFPPHGSHLAKKCWGSFNIFSSADEFRR